MESRTVSPYIEALFVEITEPQTVSSLEVGPHSATCNIGQSFTEQQRKKDAIPTIWNSIFFYGFNKKQVQIAHNDRVAARFVLKIFRVCVQTHETNQFQGQSGHG